MNKTKLYEMKNNLEIDRTYLASLARSYESKLDRVEPLSQEFEDTVRGLLETQRKLKEVAFKITAANFRLFKLESDSTDDSF